MFQKAIDINPEVPNYHNTLAWLYFSTGQREKAIQSQEQAIKLNPHPVYKSELEKFKSTEE